MWRLRGSAPLALLPLLFGAGCAPKVRVPLDCVPRNVTVFVDKQALEEVPETLELRADRPHVVFVKGGGYQPDQVVFEVREGEDGPELWPPDLCSQVRFVEMERELDIELE